MEAAVTQRLTNEIAALRPDLVRLAYSICKNRAAAEDTAQDAIIRGIVGLDKFTPGTNLKSWMFTITRHILINNVRKTSKMVEDPDDLISKTVATEPEQHRLLEEEEERSQSREIIQAVRRILKDISPGMRETFWLIYAEGHTYEETAEIIGCPIGTVKSRLHRALELVVGKIKEKKMEADDISPEQWSTAFSDLSMKVLPKGRRKVASTGKVRRTYDLEFCGLKCVLIQNLRFGAGPLTQVFSIAA